MRPRGLRAEAVALTPGQRRWIIGGAAAGALLAAATGLGGADTPGGPGAPRCALTALAQVAGLAAFASYGGWTVWLSLTDLRDRRLPNPVVGWASVTVAAPLAGSLVLPGEPRRLLMALAAAAAALCLFAALWVWRPGALGAGDVKLVPLSVFVPAAAGAGPWLLAFACGLAASALVGVAVAHARRDSDIGFGPPLLFASWVGAVAGAPHPPGFAPFG
nr:prepilin peptidase [Leucobacter luti]